MGFRGFDARFIRSRPQFPIFCYRECSPCSVQRSSAAREEMRAALPCSSISPDSSANQFTVAPFAIPLIEEAAKVKGFLLHPGS